MTDRHTTDRHTTDRNATDSRSTLVRATTVAVAALVVASLGVGPVASLADPNAATVQDPENSQVRIAHMSADAPAVDVRVGNETVAQDLEFGDVTDYLDLQEGEYRVSIVTAENETTVSEVQLSVPANERLTVAAIGQVAENATEEFRLVALSDARRAPTGANASVRLVHVSPDLGPVDVTVNRTGEVLFDDVTFGNATEYVTVPSGVYTLNVREAAEGNNGTLLSTHTESLQNRTAYSVFAAPEDEQPDEPVALFVAIDQTDNPEIPGATTVAEDSTTTAENMTTTAENATTES
ncbi:DUF4397 domain-containing protein [Halorussus salinus]|uniref:DUF4397 domain-containing protein n=1 Tax=Halorussus salinus TaxID=1364935 RepID=UPI0010920DB5|nr:DUF4397 domain-containing protein [Halorussus salinus]